MIRITDIRFVYKGNKWLGTLILYKAKQQPLKYDNTQQQSFLYIFFCPFKATQNLFPMYLNHLY